MGSSEPPADGTAAQRAQRLLVACLLAAAFRHARPAACAASHRAQKVSSSRLAGGDGASTSTPRPVVDRGRGIDDLWKEREQKVKWALSPKA